MQVSGLLNIWSHKKESEGSWIGQRKELSKDMFSAGAWLHLDTSGSCVTSLSFLPPWGRESSVSVVSQAWLPLWWWCWRRHHISGDRVVKWSRTILQRTGHLWVVSSQCLEELRMSALGQWKRSAQVINSICYWGILLILIYKLKFMYIQYLLRKKWNQEG